MKEENIKIIREAAIKANPKRSESWEYDTGAPVGSGYIKQNPCRLADVLLAIRSVKPANKTLVILECDGQFCLRNVQTGMIEAKQWWNLLKDSLEDQSEETLQFLADLLK